MMKIEESVEHAGKKLANQEEHFSEPFVTRDYAFVTNHHNSRGLAYSCIETQVVWLKFEPHRAIS